MKTKLLHSTSKTEDIGFLAGELAKLARSLDEGTSSGSLVKVKSLSHKVNLDFSNRTAGLAGSGL